MKKLVNNRLFLSVLSGLILFASWTEFGTGWFTMIGFVPLLKLLDIELKSYSKLAGTSLFLYSLLSFLIWNICSTWWIVYATLPGGITVICLNSIFMAFTMYMIFLTFQHSGRRIGYIAFVSYWIAFEYLQMYSQLSWPWLMLGNAYANNISLIQWYEFVGHFGGSIWVLIINLTIYEILRVYKIPSLRKKAKTYIIGLCIIILVPIGYSIVRFYTYKELYKPINVVIIQPNVDSYNEKFCTPVSTQIKKLTSIITVDSGFEPDYFIAPETAIPNGFFEKRISEEFAIKHLVEFLQDYPNSHFIVGATTRKEYKDSKEFTKTCHKKPDGKSAYDIFNSSIQVSPKSQFQLYHKSRLVPGIETRPFPKITHFFTGMITDLGGISGTHGVQKNRVSFKNSVNNFTPGTPICYESAYGEFVGDFVSAGADVLFIITNDGWWRDTPGYKQHMSYSKIRAVETRRSIARSANNGISCIINQKGEVEKKLGWWQQGCITGSVNSNSKITFYVKYGDFLARMCLTIAAILVIILLLGRTMAFLKKDRL